MEVYHYGLSVRHSDCTIRIYLASKHMPLDKSFPCVILKMNERAYLRFNIASEPRPNSMRYVAMLMIKLQREGFCYKRQKNKAKASEDSFLFTMILNLDVLGTDS